MHDPEEVPGFAERLRTRALWWLMRCVPYPRLEELHRSGRMRLIERRLLGGDLVVLGGLSPRLRLSGAHFAPWGAQAFTVLTGCHEPMVQEALRRTLAPGMAFLDVPANIGATALLAATFVGPKGRVVAIDAQPECVAVLEANAARNGFTHMTALHAAVGRETGEAEIVVAADALWTRLASVGGHPLETRRDVVRATTLDALVAHGEVPVPDVVNVDVEGAELDVLAGMQRLLTSTRPVVICEMHSKNAEFCDAMEAVEYRVVDLDAPGSVATGRAEHPRVLRAALIACNHALIVTRRVTYGTQGTTRLQAMRVLLTNDDGIQAAGLQALRTALLEVPGVDLVTIAPDGNRSAIGRGITTRAPLSVERVEFDDGTHGYQTDGTPVDCVRLMGLGLVEGWTADIVVAGINHGANLGDDVTYSGTVAAAMEGLMLGLPAVAVSQQFKRGDTTWATGDEAFDFSHSARFTARLVEGIEDVPLPAGVLINVNVPGGGEPEGVEVCRLGKRIYRDELKLDSDEGGVRRFWIYGAEPSFEDEPGTDLAAVHQGRVAVTPVHMDFTHHDGIGPLSEAELHDLLAPAVREFEG